jgi:hypothetical protein
VTTARVANTWVEVVDDPVIAARVANTWVEVADQPQITARVANTWLEIIVSGSKATNYTVDATVYLIRNYWNVGAAI